MIKRFAGIFFLAISILYGGAVIAQAKDTVPGCRYIKNATGYLMVLRQGDDVMKELEKLGRLEQLPFASVTGIGFAHRVTFGFYDFERKKFNPKTFNKVEMANLTGSIAWSDGQPSLHLHGTATDEKFDAYGGHILELSVGTGSMEIYLHVQAQKLQRKVEQPLNANVLQLECPAG